MTRTSAILEQLLTSCAPAHARAPLEFLEWDSDVRVCPADPAAALAALTGSFAIDELVASGVARLFDDGEVRLAPALTAPNELLIVLRDGATGVPYDIVTEAGCASAELPVLAALRDRHMQTSLAEDSIEDVFAAFTIADVAVLRACGLPATLAHGLERLPARDLNAFCAAFGLEHDGGDRDLEPGGGSQSFIDLFPRPNCQTHGVPPPPEPSSILPPDAGTASRQMPPSTGASDTPRLVIVGWQPSKLDGAEPSQLQSLLQHAAKLERLMGVDWSEAGQWSPEDGGERLSFVAESGSHQIFEAALRESAANSDEPLALPGTTVDPPADYTTALTRRYAVASHGGSLAGWDGQRTWADLQRLQFQELIQPLHELAAATENPIARTLIMQLAEISYHVHNQSVLIGEQLNRRLSADGGCNATPLPPDAFKTLLQLSDALIRTTRATQLCSQPKTTHSSSRAVNSQTTPRLPHCG